MLIVKHTDNSLEKEKTLGIERILEDVLGLLLLPKVLGVLVSQRTPLITSVTIKITIRS